MQIERGQDSDTQILQTDAKQLPCAVHMHFTTAPVHFYLNGKPGSTALTLTQYLDHFAYSLF